MPIFILFDFKIDVKRLLVNCAPKEAAQILPFRSRVKLTLLIRSIVQHAHAILADSEHGRNLLSAYCRTSPERIVILPFKPAFYLVSESKDRTSEVMQKCNIKPSYFFLPWRWGSYKNTERVLAARKLVSSQGTNKHLVLW